MKFKPRALLLIICLAFPCAAQARKPIIYTTPPKSSAAQLKQADGSVYEVRGQATYTPAVANFDATLTGTFVYTLPDEARQKIAALAGKPLAQVPAYTYRQGVRAEFQRGTSCPLIHWEIQPLELEVLGVLLSFKRLVVDVYEAPGYLPQLFCNWARQLKTRRSYRGIVAAINRALTGEEDAAPPKPKEKTPAP